MITDGMTWTDWPGDWFQFGAVPFCEAFIDEYLWRRFQIAYCYSNCEPPRAVGSEESDILAGLTGEFSFEQVTEVENVDENVDFVDNSNNDVSGGLANCLFYLKTLRVWQSI